MRARILIVEDDDLQGAVLRDALGRRGHAADIAKNGLDAVRKLRQESYDVAVIDYRIPDIDGLAAARLIHDLLGELQRPRLIAVTAAADALNAQASQGGDMAFDAVVSKDLGLSALLEVIDQNLSSAATLRAVLDAAERRYASARAGQIVKGRQPLQDLAKMAPDDPFRWPPHSDGQVHVISINAFKLVTGPRWGRIGLKAMMKAELIIKRMLSFGDVFVRGSDHAFIIWFSSADLEGNQAALAKIVRELRLRFLSDFGDEALPAAYSTPAEVARFLPGLQAS